MLSITPGDLCFMLTAVLLLGMVLGVALSDKVGSWVARTFDRLCAPIPLRQLKHPVRAAIKEARGQSLPLNHGSSRTPHSPA